MSPSTVKTQSISALLAELARTRPIAIPVLIFSVFRTIWVTLVSNNPLLWGRLLQGSRNPMAEIDGPYYIPGAPYRNLEDGKGILASIEELKTYVPYLFSVTVKGPKGEPVPHAEVDMWQANTAGQYHLTTYGLRGKFRTDDQGKLEILTVAPGRYGSKQFERVSHFHLKLRDVEGKQWEDLTTQLYVLEGNNWNLMGADIVTWWHRPNNANMIQSWCIPSEGNKRFYDFNTVSPDEIETQKKIGWWNQRLAEANEDVNIVAGGEGEVRMNQGPRFYFF